MSGPVASGRAGARRRRTWALVGCLAAAACLRSSTYTDLDVGGSAVHVQPLNLAGDARARARVDVGLWRADGRPVLEGGLTVALQVDGCEASPAAVAVDALGTAQFSVGGCASGLRSVQAQVRRADLLATVPATAQLNVFRPLPGTELPGVGTPLTAAFVALGADGQPQPGYAGTVHYVSSDPGAVLPPDRTLAAADGGAWAEAAAVVLRRAGTQTVTAVDVASGRVVAQQMLTVGDAAGHGSLQLSAAAAQAGAPLALEVAVLDASGAPQPGYVGTLTLACDDPLTQLPPPYAMGPADGGRHAFTGLTPWRAGALTLTVGDAAGLTGRLAVPVAAAPAAALRLAGPQAAVAGVPAPYTVQAVDAFGNLAPTFVGPLRFTCTDPNAALPAAAAVGAADGGTAEVAVRFVAAAAQSLAVASGAWQATLGPIAVRAAAAQSLRLGLPATAVAGQPFALRVLACDAYGNVATGFAGAVNVRSDDPRVPLLAPLALSAGAAAAPAAVLLRAGATQVRAADLLGALPVAQASLAVQVGPAAALQFAAAPSGGAAGAAWAQQPVVQVQDAAGNRVAAGADAAVPVAVQLLSGGGRLGGSAAAPAAAGQAAFAGLYATAPAAAAVLRASATLGPGPVQVDSPPFAVTLNAAAVQQWAPATATAAGFAWDANRVDLVAAAAERTAAGVDDRAARFSGAAAGASFDAALGALRLGAAGGCDGTQTQCAGLDPSWTPAYAQLLGYWPWESGGATSVAVGAAAPGAVGPALTVGGAPLGFVSGHVRQGASLTAGTALRVPAGLVGGSALGIAAWVQWFGGAAGQHLFDFGQDANHTVYLAVADTNGLPHLGISTAGVAGESAAVGGVPLPLGVWTHVAASVGGGQAALYINGAPVAQVATSLTPTTVAGGQNCFGCSHQPGGPTFAGAVDEVALFAGGLSAAQVARLVAIQGPSLGGVYTSRVLGPQPGFGSLGWSPTLPFGKPLPDGGPSEAAAAYPQLAGDALMQGITLSWHLEEAALGGAPGGADVADSSGQSSGGAAQGNVLLAVPGRLGRGVAFAGDGAYLATQATYDDPQVFSLAVWFSASGSGGGPLITFMNDLTQPRSNDDRLLYLDAAGHVFFGIFNGTSFALSSPDVYADGQWHLAVGTFDNGALTLYVDGAAVRPTAQLGAAQSYTGNWVVGYNFDQDWPAGPSTSFTGRVDEVAIWGRALGAAEVAQLFRRGANQARLALRLCAAADCSDAPPWRGDDGSPSSSFSELNNALSPLAAVGRGVLAGAPSLNLAAFPPALPSLPFAQYRVWLGSDDLGALCDYGQGATACSPELAAVEAGPRHFVPGTGQLTALSGPAMYGLQGLQLTYGPAGCPGGVALALSLDGGTTWWWYDGSRWAVADGTAAQSTAAAALTPGVLAGLVAAAGGGGPARFTAWLASDGTTPCALQSVALTGNP